MLLKAPMPAVFFGHGSPVNTLQCNEYTSAWRAFAASLPTPRAIVVVSAHWYVAGVRVTGATLPATIHDFNSRFDRSLFAFEYHAPGSPEIAQRIVELLTPQPVEMDTSWGIDHGAYSVLANLYPDASVPVIQLAIDRSKPPEEHYRLARRLQPLRAEGVLIVGSGNVIHNLELADFGPGHAAAYDWARRHEERIRSLLAAGDHERLVAYRNDGNDAKLAIPTPEHYLPFLYVLAQQSGADACTTFAEGFEGASIGMLSVSLGL